MTATNELAFPNGPTTAIQRPDPMVLLQSAIEKGLDPDQLGKLMDLQERYERKVAETAFANALAAFQSECPPIGKLRRAADRFKYAAFEDIMRIVSPLLAKNGITIAFDSEQADGNLKVTVRLRVGSYFEDRTFATPIPMSLKVSEPQQFGAALSYAKRYAVVGALNLVMADEDDENTMRAWSVKPISKDQIADIERLIAETGSDLARFLEAFKVKSLAEMTQEQHARALRQMVTKATNGNGHGQSKRQKAGAAS